MYALGQPVPQDALLCLSGMVWRKYLKHMQLLKGWESNVESYVPIADRSSGRWPLQVYYDPVPDSKHLGSIAGANKLTMQFQGTVSNAPACVMMDSMCSHTLMGASFARRLGITVAPDERLSRLRLPMVSYALQLVHARCALAYNNFLRN